MSGGHFEYRSLQIQYFADEIKAELRGKNLWMKSKTIKTLRRLLKHIEKSAKYARAIEWLYSGDTCDESFAEEVGRIERRKK